MSIFKSAIAQTVFHNKYAHEGAETWENLSSILVHEVCDQLLTKEEISELTKLHSEMKFIAGGRYLYYAGRDKKFYNNCFLFKSTEDTRESWADLSWKAQTCLMTGGGIGNDYSVYREEGAAIERTGGTASGPISTMNIINEIGRNVMQGGSRRCLQKDSKVVMSDSTRKSIKDVKEGDLVQTRFGAKKVLAVADQGVQDLLKIETKHGTVLCTSNHKWLAANSQREKKWMKADDLKAGNKLYFHPYSVEGSVEYDIEEAYVLGFYMANGCAYHSNRTHEVTFQVDEKYYSEDFINLLKRVMGKYSNPIERKGHGKCIELRCRSKDLVDKFQEYKKPHEKPNIPNVTDWKLDARYAFLAGWFDADGCYSGSWKLCNFNPETLIELKDICLSMGLHTTINGNELRFSDYQRNHFVSTIGEYSFKLRIKQKEESFKIDKETNEIPSKILSITKVASDSTFDIEVEDVNEFIADNFVSHNSALYASLNWRHPDAGKMLTVKDWKRQNIPGTSMSYSEVKEKDFNFPAPLDMTNISLNYDNKFLEQIHGEEAEEIYKGKKEVKKDLILPSMFLNNVRKACENGEPGFSFNFYDKEKETARNACQPGFAKVLTKEGVKRFDEVEVGTEIWSVDGWTKIVKKWCTGTKKVYEVLFTDDRSKFVGTLNHKIVSSVNYKDDSFVKEELQTIILDKLPVKTFSYSSDSILERDAEGLIAGTFTEENYVKSHKLLGMYSVFDITVDNKSHTYWTEGVNVSNCTEVSSEDDSDVCNLGSLNMANIETYQEWCVAVELAFKFLFCGTLKAELPYEKVYEIREKNRRIGLGIMGVHEWLLKRGYRYEVVPELHKWLQAYKDISDRAAIEMSKRLGVSLPVAKRAIAPTGSIGMLAATTTGIEPLFAVAFKRRYLKDGTNWHYQYVIDGTAKMLINEYGLDPNKIETAIDLAQDYERRIKFQADVQDYVDMSISSTINLPAWGSDLNNESTVENLAQSLGKYAHRLRGFTCYPDGSRGGQPLTSVSYHEAFENEGSEFKEEFNDICVLTGKGGTCGS